MTDQTIIERAARAIQDATYPPYSIRLTKLVDDAATYTLTAEGLGEPMEFDSHADASEFMERRIFEGRATAAIKAMREPTQQMTQRGAEDSDPVGCCLTAPLNAADVWKIMIDAALGEG